MANWDKWAFQKTGEKIFSLALDRGFGTIASRPIVQAANLESPTEIPDASTIVGLMNAGIISQELGSLFLGRQGVYLDKGAYAPQLVFNGFEKQLDAIWRGVEESGIETPSITDLIALFWRGVIDKGEFDVRARREGWKNKSYLLRHMQAGHSYPNVSDFFRFHDSFAFNGDQSGFWGLSEEFPPDLIDQCRATGLRSPVAWPGNDGGREKFKSWAELFWRSHWTWPSINQGLDAVYRLRPTDADPRVARDPSGIVFGQGSFDVQCRALNLPRKWREIIWALRFKPLGYRQVGTLLDLRMIDEVQAVEIVRDNGYSKDDATTLVSAIARREQVALRKSRTRQAIKQVQQAYLMGAIDSDSAQPMLYRLFHNDPATLAKFTALPANQQIATAAADNDVRFEMSLLDSQINLGEIAGSVASVRRRFFRGQISAAQLGQALRLSGLTVTASIRQARQLQREFTPPRREMATGNLMKLYRRGLLGAAQVAARLSNLGWSTADLALLVAETDQDIALDLARAQEKAARTLAQQQRAQAAQIRAAQRAAAAAQKRLAGHASEAQLERWHESGLISDTEFSRRLQAMGYSAADVQRIVAYGQMQANARKAKKGSGKGTKPPAGSKGPSAAALARWAAKGILSDADATQRIVDLGWTQADAADLIQAAKSKGKGAASGQQTGGTNAGGGAGP